MITPLTFWAGVGAAVVVAGFALFIGSVAGAWLGQFILRRLN